MKALKTFAAATVLTLASVNAFAKPNFCKYTDFIHLSSETPPTVHIQSISWTDGVKVKQVDATSFFISDADNCPQNGGDVRVMYVSDEKHFCELNIHDGELDYHPVVTVPDKDVKPNNCVGLKFTGVTYDGFATFKYSIHFSL